MVGLKMSKHKPTCPSCRSSDLQTIARQYNNIVDVGWKCNKCLNEFGFEIPISKKHMIICEMTEIEAEIRDLEQKEMRLIEQHSYLFFILGQ